jgi:mono/diheme cytochrome c family protein
MARTLAPIWLIATLALCAAPAVAHADNPEKAELVQRGKALVTNHCSRCHAVERTGASSHPQAPPFRTLSRRYPIDALAEALGEGLSTGHPDMPEFVFEVADVGAILAYLQSIQEDAQPDPQQPSRR